MLYLAIDQHKAHLTINIRNEQGNVIQKGQIRNAPADIEFGSNEQNTQFF